MTLYVLLGPTAVGKTELALQMAEKLGSPILNCDSRQIYRDMEIGTAAPTKEQQQRVKHYFVGTHDIGSYYSAAQYEQDVLSLIEELVKTHQSLLLSGGSMMYIDAVCNGIDELPDPDPDIRQYVNQLYQANGLEALCAQLATLDPDYYAQVNHNDHKRMIRAVEVSLQMKKPYSQCLHQTKKQRDFKIEKYYLNRPREVLFDRINRRVDAMMEQGLLEEAQQLLPYRNLNALNTVGYKELFDYFDGKCSLEQAVTDIKTHTRRYAKRQLTWFKRDYTEKLL